MTVTVRMRASEIIEDLSLYPRLQVDEVYVARLAEALRAGATFPPLVVDSSRHRLVDGFHRRRAVIAVYGPEAEVDVEFVEYASDADLFLDTLRRNAHHGRRLTAADETKAALKARELGIEPAVVADALAIRADVLVGRLQRRVAEGTIERAVVLKPAMMQFARRTLTREQELVNKHLGGHQASYYARVLVELLEANAIDWTNVTLVQRLQRLHELLTIALAGTGDRGQAA